jgi:hypothetical protein
MLPLSLPSVGELIIREELARFRGVFLITLVMLSPLSAAINPVTRINTPWCFTAIRARSSWVCELDKLVQDQNATPRSA